MSDLTLLRKLMLRNGLVNTKSGRAASSSPSLMLGDTLLTVNDPNCGGGCMSGSCLAGCMQGCSTCNNGNSTPR
jgi:hypothetical protein